MWPSGLLLHASNQTDPGLIPGEAEAHTFCIFLSARKRQLALLVIVFCPVLSPLKPNIFSYPNFVSLLIIYNIQTVIPSM